MLRSLTILGLAMCVMACTSARAQNMVHLWDFEQSLGRTNSFTDSSGNGHTGTGSAVIVEDGKFGYGVELLPGDEVFAGDGIDYVDSTPGDTLLPIHADDNWSINVWVKLEESIPSLNYLAGFGIRGDGADSAETYFASRAVMNISEGFRLWGSHIDARSNTPFADDGIWHMYTATYDDESTAVKVFVDGEEKGEFLLSSNEDKDWVDAAAEVHLGNPAPAWGGGGFNTGGNEETEGKLDEFSIWDDALSIEQINALYDFNDVTAVFDRADLDRNGELNSLDWDIFTANGFTDLAGLSPLDAALAGDLDRDGDNDRYDFLLFKSDYIASNGAAAFASLASGVAVPEPASLVLAGLLGTAFFACRCLKPIS